MVYVLNWDNDFVSFKVDVLDGTDVVGCASVLVENLPATISEYDSSYRHRLSGVLTKSMDNTIQQKCLEKAQKIWRQ